MRKILGIGGIVVLVLLCVCAAVVAISDNASKKANPSPAVQAQVQLKEGQPTNTPKPSATPKPTNTPIPSATPKPPPPTATSLPKIGDTAKGNGVVLGVVAVEKSQGSNPYLKPKTGFVYLLVGVVIGNARPEPVPYNPLYFKVKDSTGFEYNTTLPTEQPSLKSGNLASKDTVSGIVQFEVPASAEGFILTYKPLVLFADYEEIKVILE